MRELLKYGLPDNERGVQMATNKRELIMMIQKSLKEIAEDNCMGMDFVTICALVLKLLEEALGENYTFPINVEEVANWLEVDVQRLPLNEDTFNLERAHNLVGNTFCKKSYFRDEIRSGIVLDSEASTGDQRYALAHELAHYIIHYKDVSYDSEYCIMPMLFKEMEEMVADVFATFLLIPLPIFLQEFSNYIGRRSVPIRTSEWIQYLSVIAQVPYEQVAIGYQNIRYVLGILYNIKNADNEKHRKILDSIKHLPETIREDILDKMCKYITEEYVKYLYC